MIELIKINTQVMVQSQSQNPYAVALRGTKILYASDMQLDFAITQAIEKANLDLGLKNVDEADVNHLCDTLIVECRKCFTSLTLEEVGMAIANGVRGKYDKEKVYKPTVISVTGWLNAHMQDALRIEERKKLQETKPNIPTAEELQQMRLKRITTAFEAYKHDKHYDDKGGLVFDMLNNMGKIPFSEEKEAAIWSKAKTQVIAENSKAVLHRDERNKMKEALDKIMAGDTSLIMIAAKRIALFELFDMLILANGNINEFLK